MQLIRDIPIEFRGFQKPGQQQSTEAALRTLAPVLFPEWLRTLTVELRELPETVEAEIDTDMHPYGQAVLRIAPRVYAAPDHELRDTLIHELCHLFTAPLLAFVRDGVVDDLKDSNTALHRVLQQHLDALTEQATCAIAAAFERAMHV